MRRSARRPRLHRVSRGAPRRIHTRRSRPAAAMGCQSLSADFASAFLARDQSAATNFAGLTVAASLCRGALTVLLVTATERRGYTGTSKLIRVWESLQNWIVVRRPEVFDHPAKDRIQQRTCVHDVQVQGKQFAVQMQLRLIVERIAVVIFQPLLDRPRDDVAQRVKV